MKHLIWMMLLTTVAGAQVRRMTSPPVPRSESLTLSASPGSLTFTLLPKGVALGSATLNLSLNWTITQTRSLSVFAYFSDPNAALSGGAGGGNAAVSLPSSAVLGSVYAGSQGPYQAFTQTNPFNGAASSVPLISNYSISGTGTGAGSMKLEINLANYPQIPAGTYTGVLLLQAQAI